MARVYWKVLRPIHRSNNELPGNLNFAIFYSLQSFFCLVRSLHSMAQTNQQLSKYDIQQCNDTQHPSYPIKWHTETTRHRAEHSQPHSDPKQNVENTLQTLGFDQNYIRRSLKVYDHNYDVDGYDIGVLTEIIFRLKVKDSLKHHKARQSTFQSAKDVELAL